MNSKSFALITIALLTSLPLQPASACPRIDGLIDYNCDRKLKIVAVGDSVVAGIGDSRNGNRGGYVKRLRKDFPRADIKGMGFPGYSSGRLLQDFTAALNRPGTGKTKRSLENADLIIIDVGRNDYWDKEAASLTVTNIVRLAKLFKEKVGTRLGVPPYVTIAYMLPTKRSFQWTFLVQINYYLSHLNPASFPVELRFNNLGTSSLSWDGIHPSSRGYSKMEAMIKKYLKGKLQRVERRVRTDRDKDGVYDIFELSRFKTDPTLKDTDGDTLSDGDELFIYRSDPLNAHSGQEKVPTATPTAAPTSVPSSL